MDIIPYHRPTVTQAEMAYIIEAMQSGHRHGAGSFTARSVEKLKTITGVNNILLTHSCTGALEFALLLVDIKPGDEVILPSFTFSSTANAIVLRGAIPVFADIDPKTQCLDPKTLIDLITSRTRAIIPVHYAGIACDMVTINAIAADYHLAVIEDAAQAIGCFYQGKALGSFGQLGALSFHDTKNISSGEGGALLINDETLVSRAEILWEKGTDRSKFIRGEIDKYTWVDLGSSFLPSEISAAFLLGQLEQIEIINAARRNIWTRYYTHFSELEIRGLCQRPHLPANCHHNGHIFYLILPSTLIRNQLMQHLKKANIQANFHYTPLHNSPAGKRFGKAPLVLPHTDRASQCLIRLPIFPSLTIDQQEKVIMAINEFLLAL